MARDVHSMQFFVNRAMIFYILNFLGLDTAAGPTGSLHNVGLLLNAAPTVFFGRGNIAIIPVRRPLRSVHRFYVPLYGTLGRKRQ